VQEVDPLKKPLRDEFASETTKEPECITIPSRRLSNSTRIWARRDFPVPLGPKTPVIHFPSGKINWKKEMNN
jgi:hypothetical protein